MGAIGERARNKKGGQETWPYVLPILTEPSPYLWLYNALKQDHYLGREGEQPQSGLHIIIPHNRAWMRKSECAKYAKCTHVHMVLVCSLIWCQWWRYLLAPLPFERHICDGSVAHGNRVWVNRRDIERKMISVHLQSDKRVFFFSFISHWSLVHCG